MLSQQSALDLFTLAVVEKALDAHEDHHVVANGPPRQDELSQGLCTSADQGTIGLMTSRRTYMHCLESMEDTVGEGVSIVLDGLLHQHWSTAYWTNSGLLAHDYQGLGEVVDLPRALFLQTSATAPQVFERFEGGSSVFFPGTRRNSA